MPETTFEPRKKRSPSELIAQLAEMRNGYNTFEQPMAPVPPAPGGFAANPGGNMTNLSDRMRQLGPMPPAVDPRVTYVPGSGEVRGQLNSDQAFMALAARSPNNQLIRWLPVGHPARRLADEYLAAQSPPSPAVAASPATGQFNVPSGAGPSPSPAELEPGTAPAPAASAPAVPGQGIAAQLADPAQMRRDRYATIRQGISAQRQRLLDERTAAIQNRDRAIAASPTLQAVQQNAQFGRRGGAMLRALGGSGNGAGSVAQAFMMGGPQYAAAVAQDLQMRQSGQQADQQSRLN